MTPQEFWHCTPRKLAALSSVHADMNNPKKAHGASIPAAGSVPGGQKLPDVKSAGGRIGAPNAFIDQI